MSSLTQASLARRIDRTTTRSGTAAGAQPAAERLSHPLSKRLPPSAVAFLTRRRQFRRDA